MLALLVALTPASALADEAPATDADAAIEARVIDARGNDETSAIDDPPSTAIEPVAPLETCPDDLECHVGRDGVRRAYRRTEEHRTQTDLIVIGASMLGGVWLANIAASGPGALALANDPASGARGDDYFGWSFVPLIGPVVQMFQLGDEHWAIPLLAIVEAVEVVGLILALVGTAGEDVVLLEPVAGVRIAPWAGEGGAGAVALGSF